MDKPFSCVHFIREIRSELGGVVTAGVDLCQSMASQGHRITLVTCDAKDAPAYWKEPEGKWPTVVEVPASSITELLLSRKALARFEEVLSDVDVAHLHTPWELCNFQLARILRHKRIPYVVTIHGMLDDWSMNHKKLKKSTFLSIGGRSLFRKATTIHFTAQAEKEQALQWIPGADRSLVQCYALDLSSYNPLPGVEPALRAFPQIHRDSRKILFLSRVHPKKGLELLLRAAAILKQQSLPFQILIAGPGDAPYVASLNKLAAELGVDDVTLFLGMVRGVEKRSLYEAADVFVLPTYQENFGLVLAEAMACGTAVVTTHGTDVWRELQEGGALIVDTSPDQIAEAILVIISDPEKCRRIGQQGLDFVYKWLDRNTVSAAYERMYRNAIERGCPPFRRVAPE